MSLTEEQWRLIQPLIEPHLPHPGARGRPPIDERRVLEGIFWKLSNNAPWYGMPPAYPPYQTCYRRYRQWQRLGVLDAIFQTLYQDLLVRGGVDLEQALQNGRIRFERQEGSLHCVIDPQLHGSWQLYAILLFLGMAVRKMKSYRTLTTE
jgi:transposase